MCGILGIATVRGRTLALDDREVIRMRDAMTHRGPDDAGLWRCDHIALAHRRLSVIDPTPAGHQPMLLSDDGRSSCALVYNGELYNDAELRSELAGAGVRFRTSCDTETLLHALDQWGESALTRIRGMYALAFCDLRRGTILLARDPLGVKPLYWCDHDGQVIFASEPTAILAHPRISPVPNMAMVSAYLTTIRTVLGEHTLFEGIRALRPGTCVSMGLSGDSPRISIREFWRGPSVNHLADDPDTAAAGLRATLDDSIDRHLRADVPTCALLSGGLDSSLIALRARERQSDLRTYCAGAHIDNDAEAADPLGAGADLAFAQRAADFLGTRHAEAVIDRASFDDRWEWMVDRLGVPLSTPNEIAIHAVASRLREDGCVVTISGEGADELLAGYEAPMDQAAAYLEMTSPPGHPGVFCCLTGAWVGPEAKPRVLRQEVWQGVGSDELIDRFYRSEWDACVKESGSEGLEAVLRLQRRTNLVGLLQRLDTATMLASVEGRTPFADGHVASLLESLPIGLKYRADEPAPARCERAVALEPEVSARSKIVLRRAYASSLPSSIVNRPKSSFPLPFTRWMDEAAGRLDRSQFAREVFSPEAIDAVRSAPVSVWSLAWPMLNLAAWGRRWWG